MSAPTDVEKALSQLKDFQRLTVDTVFDRLWGTTDPVPRFLVADEVGLGKTLVARGVVAKTIEHLQQHGEERIDIVYICSNSQIAQQNLRRLHDGVESRIKHADRLTLLPRVLHEMNRPRGDEAAINVISFTPGTSFNLGGSGGVAGERALLHVLLERLWGRAEMKKPKWEKFFRGGASEARMANERSRVDRSTMTEDLLDSFRQGLSAATFGRSTVVPLEEALRENVEAFNRLREGQGPARKASTRRYYLIGALRHVLAEACVGHLDPDLVILDEFQRFTSLLHGNDDAALLAQHLLGDDRIDVSNPHTQTRVLMLSATPFKMYTLPDEPEGEDHYKDFVRTVEFLAGPERADVVRLSMKDMRSALLIGDTEAAVAAKDRAQDELRRVMSRTERLASSATRDGMLTEVDRLDVTLTPQDVHDYSDQSQVARALSSHDVLEYWRSAPYVFELMDKYHIKRGIERDLEAGAPVLGPILKSRVEAEQISSYEDIDLGNPKLRWLAEDVLGTGAGRIAWLPPSLPYYSAAGPFTSPGLDKFTKRLVFSAWTVAPKAIATMLSYEVERRLVDTSTSVRHDYFDKRRTGLLAFRRGPDGRLGGMPVLGLLYPSTSLARLGDPLEVAQALAASLPLDRSALLDEVCTRVERALEDLPPGSHDGNLPPGAWYWAAPILLDRSVGTQAPVAGLSFGSDRRRSAAGDGTETLFESHLQQADELDLVDLGPRPDDLADVLARMAVAGPGVTALRALARVVGGDHNLGAPDLRSAATDWSWALRNLFNSAELVAMLKADDESAYWRLVLDHCLDGNLQSVLDEYAEVLVSSRSLRHESRDRQLRDLATGFAEGSGLRAAPQAMDFFGEQYEGHRDRRRIRSHFAVRYGRHKAMDDQSIQRESQLRDAFNSPFWPFVLASTSVGQEGLDFHHYSHAIVHWNLPGNPVDLEQREGRVHRYRGHAVRKNVARALGNHPDVLAARNPWEAMFDLAVAGREDGQSEIVPDWVYTVDGGATIERYVPVLPMSRERQHYRRLLRTLGAYRLTLGHPRQSDLIAYVGTSADLALDLAPHE